MAQWTFTVWDSKGMTAQITDGKNILKLSVPATAMLNKDTFLQFLESSADVFEDAQAPASGGPPNAPQPFDPSTLLNNVFTPLED